MQPTGEEFQFRIAYSMLTQSDLANPHAWSDLFGSCQSLLDETQTWWLLREIRYIELMVGINVQETNPQILQKYYRLKEERKRLNLQARLEVNEKERMKVFREFKEVSSQIDAMIFDIQPIYDLYSIETYMGHSWDLKSYFREGGVKIYQHDIERELKKIKEQLWKWMIEKQQKIRFTTQFVKI